MIQTGISKQLEDNALKVLKYAQSCLCTIDCKLYSENVSDVSVVPSRILNMTVQQNFEVEFSDVITATIEVAVDEAILILGNYQDLICRFVFNRITRDTQEIIEEIPPQIEKYRVFIANATDLLKQFTKAELTTTQEAGETTAMGQDPPADVLGRKVNLELQLIDEDVYQKKDRPINALLNNTTLTDAVHYVANLLEIKNVDCRMSDNARTYTNFTIPPMQTIGSVFDLWQEKHGLYLKGLEAYYTHGVLYVYPGYDTDPSTEKILHMYKVQENSYLGNGSYHYENGDEVYILLNAQVALEDLSAKLTENVGNYHVALRTDSVYDVDKKMEGRNGEIRNNNLISVGAQNEKMASSNKITAKYLQVTNNAYIMSSAMSQCMCKLLNGIWMYAWPFTLTPGMKVIYHYEDAKAYKSTKGILSGVVYNMVPLTQTGRLIYAWAARLTCRLTVDTDDSDAVDTSTLASLRNKPDSVRSF